MFYSLCWPLNRLHEQGQWLSQAQLFQSKREHVSRLFKSDNMPKRDIIGMPPDHAQVEFIIKKKTDSLSREFKSDHSRRPPTIPWLAQAVRLELLGHVIKSRAKLNTHTVYEQKRGAETSPPIDGSKTSMTELDGEQQNYHPRFPHKACYCNLWILGK